MEREEQQYELKLTALRAAVDEGDASGIADGDVFAKLREKLDLAPRWSVAVCRFSRAAEAGLVSICVYTLRSWGPAADRPLP